MPTLYSNRSDRIAGAGSTGHRINNRPRCSEHMSLECIREGTGTYFDINGGKQCQLCYSNRSDRIAGAGSTGHRINNRPRCSEHMSLECIWKLTGTYFDINGAGKQCQLCYSNRSDRIAGAGSTGHRINNRPRCSEHMSLECIWKLTGTYFDINCAGKQCQLCYSNRSDRIAGAGSTGHRINNRPRCREHMSLECIWKLTGTYFDINGAGKQCQLCYSNRSDRIAGAGSTGHRINNRPRCSEHMSLECIREGTGTYFDINGAGK